MGHYSVSLIKHLYIKANRGTVEYFDWHLGILKNFRTGNQRDSAMGRVLVLLMADLALIPDNPNGSPESSRSDC